MIKKYTKKPVEVEAIQLNFNTVTECLKFSGGKLNPKNGDFEIQTLEGVMTAQSGDYIIKGIKGEFYPCKPGIFELSYSEKKETSKSLGDLFNQTPPFNPNQGVQPIFTPPTTMPDMNKFWYGGYARPQCDVEPSHSEKLKNQSSVRKSGIMNDLEFLALVEDLIGASR